jgi:hypothetical protein
MRALDGPLGSFFALQERALSNLARPPGEPEARARLLGGALLGGSVLTDPHGGLRALLRRRLATLHAEFRTLSGAFHFVEVGEHPGIAREQAGDAWIGRALLLNAPVARLARAEETWGYEVPRFLDGAEPAARRLSIHLRALREAIPEPLAARAIFASTAVPEGISLAVLPSPRGARFVELVARAVGPLEPAADVELAREMRTTLAEVLPPDDQRILAAPIADRPLWDDDAALHHPPPGASWSALPNLRVGGRRPIYRLAREAVAALGVEGDLLLGCHAGDTIREELGP